MFHLVLGQESAVLRLRQDWHRQQIPPAYLFRGLISVGKRKVALALAQALNCEDPLPEDACGDCSCCRQILFGSFPNLQIIEPDGKDLKVEQIRNAIEWLQWKPESKQHRILIIESAESMNSISANALLKTLEEPPEQSLIILLSGSSKPLLETITSRCRLVLFKPLSSEIIQSIFCKERNLTPEQAQWLSRFALGTLRSDWMDPIESVIQMRDRALGFLEQVSMGQIGVVLPQITEWMSSSEQSWQPMLDFLEYFLRDIACVLTQIDRIELLNIDCLESLRKVSFQISLKQVIQAQQFLIDARKQLSFNANKVMIVEALWLQWHHLFLSGKITA